MLSKKNFLIFAATLSFTYTNDSRALSIGEFINYFDFGYKVGVSPLLWPYIPSLALGYGLQANNIPSNKQASAYLLGAAGCITGIAVIGFATYGIKQFTKNVISK